MDIHRSAKMYRALPVLSLSRLYLTVLTTPSEIDTVEWAPKAL